MRYQIQLPQIDYGPDNVLEYPFIANQPVQLPDRFKRYGTQKDEPFHCFVDDWRIEAIWRHRYKMSEKAVLSGVAIAPDFTVELDYPVAYAFYQVWRSRVIARYWQDHGVYVIPVLQWSRPEINHLLFAGLQDCEIVAVRSATKGNEQQWRQCAQQYLEQYSPKLVLHFGTKKGLDVWSNVTNVINYNLR